MEKNFNLEIFFISQMKSLVISTKNKISFDEIKKKVIKEFNIPKENEKDFKFTILVNNQQVTILNDAQIMKNLVEMSKNNYYLKLNFDINNENYKQFNSRKDFIKNNRIKPHYANSFYLSSKNKIYLNDEENKYEEEIKKLKEELEDLKSEKTIKGDFDLRKFDEKYRDLNNKNNDLNQKIIELENENKILKNKIPKNNNDNNTTENILFENNTVDNDYIINEIEKCIGKLIGEHDNNIIKEINNIKVTLNNILDEQKVLTDKINNIDMGNNKIKNIEKDTYFEVTKGYSDNENNNNSNINNDKDNNDNKKNNEKIKIIINNSINNINNDNLNEDNNNEKVNENNNKDNINDNKFDILDNLEYIDDHINSNIEHKEDDEKNDILINTAQIIKRNNSYFNEEDEKTSKSFKTIKNKNKSKNIIKELKNKFFEKKEKINENNISNTNLNFKKINKKYFTKYSSIQKKLMPDKINIENKKQDFNINDIRHNFSGEEFINYDSSSEIYSDIKKNNRIKAHFLNKISKKKNKFNSRDKYTPNETTPCRNYKMEKRGKNYSYKRKKENSVTPNNNKVNNIKENIENYYIKVFQNIFFYEINGYVNILNISDKLINKLKEGIRKYPHNLSDIKDVCIRYISYSILPIVNDPNTKEYQRKMIKSKISTVLKTLRIERNYFDKEYKDINNDKKEKSDDKNMNLDVNVTHAKINEFRKFYDLNEKDYPDELIIKALIRYRGNREMAFQYIFY